MNQTNKDPHDFPQRFRKALDQANLNPQRRRVLEHLPRLELFLFLMERPMSDRELAEAFGMSVRLVEYHLRVLSDADLIERLTEEQKATDTQAAYVASTALQS